MQHMTEAPASGPHHIHTNTESRGATRKWSALPMELLTEEQSERLAEMAETLYWFTGMPATPIQTSTPMRNGEHLDGLAIYGSNSYTVTITNCAPSAPVGLVIRVHKDDGRKVRQLFRVDVPRNSHAIATGTAPVNVIDMWEQAGEIVQALRVVC